MDQHQQFPWRRLWFSAGAGVSRTHGYLPDNPTGRAASEAVDHGVTLDELRKVPCLVLLGTPGLGKTNEMHQAARQATARGEICSFISLGRLSGPEELEEQISLGAKSEEHDAKIWHIFLDGLDEALFQLTQKPQVIPNILRALTQLRNLETVRLRISCRSAEWPASLESELQSLWGKDSVKIYELAKLSKSDATVAAEQVLATNAQSFLEQIEKHEAETLASRPVTLIMLLNVFRKDLSLPRQQVQLYRQALLASIEETNATRRAYRQTWRLDARSRLMVAARIAASSIFSNSPEIWTGLQSQLPPGRAITLSSIAGGYEPALGMSFPVGEAELYDVLLTSLFERIGEDRFTWTHQTFAEFLSAYYLVERGLIVADMLQFLRGADDTARIPPQLREVAAWLASMSPEFFRAVVKSEPDILLRSDVASADAQDRALLVQELLLRLDKAEIHDFDYQWHSRFDRLSHPGLRDQLRPYIQDKSKHVIARRVAIALADANGGLDLGQLFADVALDSTDDIHIRDRAARALAKTSDLVSRAKLKVFLGQNYGSDPNDDLKGSALRALWPTFLTVRELLEALTPPKASNYFGVYASFISNLELPKLKKDEAVEILDWLALVASSEKRGRSLRRLIGHFLDRVWECADDIDVINQFASFFSTLVVGNQWFSLQEIGSSIFPKLVAEDSSRRRALVSAIVRVGSKRGWAWLAFNHPIALVTSDDLPWLIEQLLSTDALLSKDAAIELILAVISTMDLNSLGVVWSAGEAFPQLADALQRIYSVELSSAVAKWQREDFERRKQLDAVQDKNRFDVLSALDDRLRRVEAESSFEWWELNLLFFVEKNGNLGDELHSDLTATSLWATISDATRERIKKTAERYLSENRLGRLEWLGTNTFHRPAAAGYRAFRLLLSESPDRLSTLSNTVWSNWVGSIIGVSFNEDQAGRSAQAQLFEQAYQRVPTSTRRAIARMLLRDHSEFAVRHVTGLVDTSFDSEVGRLLWNLLKRLEGEKATELITAFLASKRYESSVQLISRAMESGSRDDIPELRKEGDFIAAVTGLIQPDPMRVWTSFIRFRERNEGLAWKIVENLAEGSSFQDGSFVDLLDEPSLGDLYAWTYRRLPPKENKEAGQARFLGVPDHIDFLRNHALRRLVSMGTPASVAAVQKLALEVPGQDWLRLQLVDARRALDAKTWARRDPAEVITAIALYQRIPPPQSTKAAIQNAVAKNEIEKNAIKEIAAGVFPPTIPLNSTATTKPPNVVSRRILLVATEWLSGHGGISTFNREFCKALAAVGHQVACLVMDASSSEVTDAAAAGVQLIAAPTTSDPSIGDQGRLLLFYPTQLDSSKPDIVVGHDHITGTAAQHIAHRVYRIPYVHFVHTLPEEIEPFKTRIEPSVLRGAQKAEFQSWQCKQAQLVVTVGRRIFRDISMKLESNAIPVIELSPGFDKGLLAHNVDLKKPRSAHCVLMARLEDAELKGASLACKMIRALCESRVWSPSKRPSLVLRGFDPERAEQEAKAIDGFLEAKDYLFSRPYTTDTEVITNEICTASVVIMPSKREGFGLAALEAIAAGVPVIITSESGLAELLIEKEVATVGSALAASCVVDVNGEPAAVTKKWVERLDAIVSDPEKAFADADKLRKLLIPLLTWERAAREFSERVESLIPKPTEA